jgi:signal transduction histidine kinase/CheY-like chemotaxis protein
MMQPLEQNQSNQSTFLTTGGGEAGDLFRKVDWSQHPLGPTEFWPLELKNTLNILFHSQQPLFISWCQQNFLFYNSAYIPGYGGGKKIGAMGESGTTCWKENWAVVKSHLDSVMTDGRATHHPHEVVVINRKEQPAEVYWTYNYTPILKNDGAVGGVLIFCTETNRKGLPSSEDNLKKSMYQAANASRLKSAFIKNISHEIRTPLDAILGFTELMKDSSSEKERSEFSKIILRNGKSLTKLFDDILELSKIETGELEIKHQVFNLENIVNEVIELYYETTQIKGISISLEPVPVEMPTLIKSDAKRIRQILINLVGNAVKFTSEGSVRIRIQPLFKADKISQIQLSIQDSGIGLSHEQISKLFLPFSPGDESSTRKYTGSGLGLALSKRLANALGGDIQLVQSELGEGSTFIATFEAQVAKDLAAVKKQNRTIKVLLVEDVLDNQILVKLNLSKRGFEVEIANNGQEGVQKARSQDFDVILMDMQMPILDGYAATEKLRQEGYNKPIIALTAHSMLEEKMRTHSVGCNAHLTKPFDFENLSRTIKLYS